LKTELHKLRLAHKNMLARCYNPRRTGFANYGARGISVCDEWRNSRDAFITWALGAGHADDLSLDRIDNDVGYCPANCRWVSSREQLLNQRRNRIITHDGISMPLSMWAERLCLAAGTLAKRLSRMSLDRALHPGPLREWRHGTRHGYETGCRCDLCKAAHAKHHRMMREKRKASDQMEAAQ